MGRKYTFSTQAKSDEGNNKGESMKTMDLLHELDDIANKPWRAIRVIRELFEDNLAEYSIDRQDNYGQECVKEYAKLEAFYSNGGSQYIDEFLKDPSKNKNYPEYHAKPAPRGNKEG